MTDRPLREPAPPDPALDRPDSPRDASEVTASDEKPPDSPGGGSVDEELTHETRESMRGLGRADLDEEMDPAAREQDDEASPPGQNSDWLPE